MNILQNLNPEQKKAVMTTDGPLLIIAGAGSGKTKVLTHRIAYLIFEKHIQPFNILAVTFTNKAAKEMKERVAQLLGRDAEEKARILPFLGTFHSICVRILREEAKTLGYKSNFAIFDETDQKTAVKKAMAKLQIDPKQYAPELIANMISGAKNELIGPDKYAQYATTYFQEIVLRVYIEYQKILADSQSLDFDDLIMKCVELFQKYPKILTKWQKRFKYILIDEYQDTNRAQYLWAKLLAARYKNICVVGDDFQAIYGWRGADIRNILNFESDFPKTRVIKLEQNYRSTKKILEAAQQVISKNLLRKEKNLWTNNEDGLPIMIYQADNEKAEAEFIIQEIGKLMNNEQRTMNSEQCGISEGQRVMDNSSINQLSYKDIVVLYRTNAQSRALEEVFMKYGLPYKIVGGTKFYSRKEIKDLLAFLQLIHNSQDLVAAERIINLPPRGITPATWKKISQIWSESAGNLKLLKSRLKELETLSSRAKKSVWRFVEIFKLMREAADKLNIVELIDFVLQAVGYKKYLLDGTIEGESRWENVQELKSVAENFAEMAPADGLAAFLEEVLLVSEIDNWDEKTDAVTLMTAHNAKGLEFAVVFMAGMEEGLFPHSKSLAEPAEMEEERRLCYVGMTRAKKRLYMIYTTSRLLYGGIQVNLPSRFLDDVPEEVAEKSINNEQRTMNNKKNKENSGFGEAVETFVEGDKIEHPKFGVGVIVQLDGDEAMVAFAGLRVKKLSLSVAPVRKVE